MDTAIRPCSSLPIFLLFILFSSLNMQHCVATDSISLGQSVSGNRTIVSEEGNFELGFFTPGNSRHYYIGIWYKTIPVQTVIWVANRATPISNTSSSELKISEDGKLVLLNGYKIPVWSSNSTPSTSNSTVAVLLDTGNLVIRNGSNTTIWQSFDHPTDTWMPGGWLGVNKITGEYQTITSWENPENPAPGPFAESMDPDGSNQIVSLWNGSKFIGAVGFGTASTSPQSLVAENTLYSTSPSSTTSRGSISCIPSSTVLSSLGV